MIALAQQNRREVKRFAKFAVVGAGGAVTDFTLLNILIQLFGFVPGLANAFSFTTAVIQNFLLNRRWTFPESRERHAGSQLAKFALVSIVGLGINMAVFLTIHHLLEPMWQHIVGNEHLGFTVSYNFAKMLATGVVLFWNFAVNRMWTYRGL